MLELGNIENLGLYIDIEEENEEQEIEVKRIPLERDLEFGEIAYFDRIGMKRNKIVKQDEENYMFYRFDEIQTHIRNYDSGYSVDDISNRIVRPAMNKKLQYSHDRVGVVNNLVKENQWIYNLLSSNRIIQKEQKSKTSFLAENQSLDVEIEKLATYLLHPKFNNKESEDSFNKLREDYDFLLKKTGKSDSEIVEMMQLRDEIDLINQGILTQHKERRDLSREDKKDEIKDSDYKSLGERMGNSYITGNLSDKLEIDMSYWLKMGFSKKTAKFRDSLVQNYLTSLKILDEQLGIGKNAKEKSKIESELIKNLGEIEYYIGEEKIVIDAPTRLSKLKRMRNDLKHDYGLMIETLVNPISFSQTASSTTEYNFNEDTWYEKENGEIVEVSKNTLLFSDINTYKGLILNYYDLKDKYKDKFKSDMWAIITYFEEILRETELSKEESLVVDMFMRNYNRKEIIDNYKEVFDKNISYSTLTSWLDRNISRKLLNTYLESLDEWLYTEKIKGEFKKCSKCEEIKLISNDRYFGKHSKSPDGFQPSCKKCESFRKNIK